MSFEKQSVLVLIGRVGEKGINSVSATLEYYITVDPILKMFQISINQTLMYPKPSKLVPCTRFDSSKWVKETSIWSFSCSNKIYTATATVGESIQTEKGGCLK